MYVIFAHSRLLVACLYIVRSAAGPTDVSSNQSTIECESHNQCPADRACEAFKCVDPCVDHCGDNSMCLVHQHIPFCGCKSGYTGTGVNCTKLPECETHDQCPADRACEAFQCIDPCEGRCGNNTFCEIRHHLSNCQCSPGYIGNPLVNCEWPECDIHEDCLVNMSCIASKCVDPCRSRCGNNSECLVHQHMANCACKPGYTGNALVNCERLEYETHDQCAPDRACVAYRCVDPCSGRCGNNSECLVHQHIPNCACKPGYTGNALVNCERLECETHDQCAPDRTCVAYRCVDPCGGRCGNNSECLVHQHMANCACKFGYVGNALTGCLKKKHWKKSYFIEDTQKMNFNESLEYCKNKGMRLATFDNEEEFKQLDETIKSAMDTYMTGYWVAGSDLAQRDVWRWHTTGREMAYLPWGRGEPNHLMYNGEEQHCVGVCRNSDGSVVICDGWCSYSYRPICEY